MDFNCGNMTDKMTNCCVEISDRTPIHVASRTAQDHDPIAAGSFVESDRIEESWADEKLVIRSLFHSDRIVSGIGTDVRCMYIKTINVLDVHVHVYLCNTLFYHNGIIWSWAFVYDTIVSSVRCCNTGYASEDHLNSLRAKVFSEKT